MEIEPLPSPPSQRDRRSLRRQRELEERVRLEREAWKRYKQDHAAEIQEENERAFAEELWKWGGPDDPEYNLTPHERELMARYRPKAVPVGVSVSPGTPPDNGLEHRPRLKGKE
jgi:hypothetical protein